MLIVGWQGSAINALGQGYELRVIASTVIGGANLMGGEGGAYGAVIGAALIEVIRNTLLMAGVDANWQAPSSACSSFSRFCWSGSAASVRLEGTPDNHSRRKPNESSELTVSPR